MGLDANLVVIKKADFEIYEQKQAEYGEVARQRSKIINSVINPIYKELTDKYPNYEAFENADDPKIKKHIKEMKDDQFMNARARLSEDRSKFLHAQLCHKIVGKKVNDKSGILKKSLFTSDQHKTLERLEDEIQGKIKAIEEFDLFKTADHEIYFRKFNALHGYIEKHIATGNQMEDQDDIFITSEQMEELYIVAKEINDSYIDFEQKFEKLENVYSDEQERTNVALKMMEDEGKGLPYKLAYEKMPVTPGPFFGSYNYGDFYFGDLNRLVGFLGESREQWQSPDYIRMYMMYY